MRGLAREREGRGEGEEETERMEKEGVIPRQEMFC